MAPESSQADFVGLVELVVGIEGQGKGFEAGSSESCRHESTHRIAALPEPLFKETLRTFQRSAG